MAITTRSLVDRSLTLLNDLEQYRWNELELIDWLNDAQRDIAVSTTDGNVVRGTVTAVAGTVQSLPTGGIRLVKVYSEAGTNNTVRKGDYGTLEAYDRDWRSGSTGVAELFFYDEREPKKFEIYPPQAGGETLNVLYTAIPDPVTLNDNITVDESYATAIVDYMTYRALSKDTEDASPELGRATAFFRAYLLTTGQKDSIDALVEPSRS